MVPGRPAGTARRRAAAGCSAARRRWRRRWPLTLAWRRPLRANGACRRRWRRPRSRSATAGRRAAGRARRATSPHLAGARAWIRGVVAERRRGSRTHAAGPGGRRRPPAADATGRPARGRLLVTRRRAAQPWQRGDGIEALLGLRTPRNFGNPGEFDYARTWRGAASAPRRSPPTTPAGAACAAPAERGRRAVRALARGTGAALADTLATARRGGRRRAPDRRPRRPDARCGRATPRAGVSHVLSISGLHVGLVAAAAVRGRPAAAGAQRVAALTARCPSSRDARQPAAGRPLRAPSPAATSRRCAPS